MPIYAMVSRVVMGTPCQLAIASPMLNKFLMVLSHHFIIYQDGRSGLTGHIRGRATQNCNNDMRLALRAPLHMVVRPRPFSAVFRLLTLLPFASTSPRLIPILSRRSNGWDDRAAHIILRQR